MTRASKKQRTCFFDLPGELRNHIYYYCFHPGNCVALATKATQLRPRPVKNIKMCVTSTLGHKDRIFRTPYDQETAEASQYNDARKSKTQSRPLIQARLMGNYKRIHGALTNWLTSFHVLLLVNKQIYIEALPLLYAATTVMTASPCRLSNFFTRIPPGAAGWVRRLELTYTTYGNSHHSDLARFRGKHVGRWTALCRQAAKLLLGLEELRVWVHVTAAPLLLDLRQDWVAPLLQFRRLTVPRTRPKLLERQTPLLTQIELELSSAYTHPFRWAHPGPEMACFELHRLFAEAIRRAMLGWSEKDAMVEWEEAWGETYREWRHHLKFKVLY